MVTLSPMTKMQLGGDQNFQRHMDFYAVDGGTFAAHGEVHEFARGADVVVLFDRGDRTFVVAMHHSLPWYGWVDAEDLVPREID